MFFIWAPYCVPIYMEFPGDCASQKRLMVAFNIHFGLNTCVPIGVLVCDLICVLIWVRNCVLIWVPIICAPSWLFIWTPIVFPFILSFQSLRKYGTRSTSGWSVELKEAAFGGWDYQVIYCGGEELRARHPIVEFEWCAGGQQRVAREVTWCCKSGQFLVMYDSV